MKLNNWALWEDAKETNTLFGKLMNKREGSSMLFFFLSTLALANLRAGEETFFFTEAFQLISEEDLLGWDHYHLAVPTDLMDLQVCPEQ